MKTVFRFEPQYPQAVFGAAFHSSLQFAFAKHNSLAHRNFTARPHKRLPCVRRELTNQQHLDRRREEFISRGTVFAGWRRAQTGTMPEQARRQHASVVQDEQFVAPKQRWQFAKLTVLPGAGRLAQQQHSRCVAFGKWPLGYTSRRKFVIEIAQIHRLVFGTYISAVSLSTL